MRKSIQYFRPLHSLILACCLSGCAANPGSQALIDAFHQVRTGKGSHDLAPQLDPRYNYLRVQIGQREVFLARGYVDIDPEGPVEVWYSAGGEVLRFREGRLIGASMNRGTSWLSVTFTQLPRWENVGDQATFERTRDVSPGYLYGLREKMHIHSIRHPEDSRLQLIPASSLTWYQEQTEDKDALPPARYGVNMTGAVPQVVYGEQCLSPDYCFSWQRWAPFKEGKP